MGPLAVYVHFPFCLKKCRYCDFLSFPASAETISSYLFSLKKEISLNRGLIEERGVKTVYFGGGTPSILPAESLIDILEEILPEGVKGQEVTIEVNPLTIDIEKGKKLKEAGFSRISLGVQSFKDEDLQILGRIHNAQQAQEAIKVAKSAGFENINLDLIFGLPGQRVGDFLLNLIKALSFNIQHISLYALTLEKNTPLYRMVQERTVYLPTDDEVRDMYDGASGLLSSSGFEHYEISNFCLPGFRSQHNQVYWHSGDYLGLGLGATSFIDSIRRKNLAKMELYQKKLEGGDKPISGQVGKKGINALREEVILHLRTSDGFREEDMLNKYPRFYPPFREKLKKLEEEGFLNFEGGRWSLKESYFFVSNEIFLRLL